MYYAVNTRVSLDMEDAFAADEPITLRARPEDETAKLSAAVVEVETGAVAARAELIPADEGWHAAELPPLPAGGYRVTVSGAVTVDPVTDVFGVFPAVP
jgi:hypothetical protein